MRTAPGESVCYQASRNLPIHPALAQEMRESLAILTLPTPNLSMIHGSIPAAMKACDDILGD